jgi:hypothetical protein
MTEMAFGEPFQMEEEVEATRPIMVEAVQSNDNHTSTLMEMTRGWILVVA